MALGAAGGPLRLWYGRMVLPPADAVHDAASGTTFGDLRRRMIARSRAAAAGGRDDDGGEEDPLALGCSGAAYARQLEEAACAAGSTYCWHRCMLHADHAGVGDAECAARGLALQCVNPRDQFSDGDSHGDYFPACSNTTEAATDYPALPGYPRDMEVCHPAAWEEFSARGDYQFEFADLGDNQGRRGYHVSGAVRRGLRPVCVLAVPPVCVPSPVAKRSSNNSLRSVFVPPSASCSTSRHALSRRRAS